MRARAGRASYLENFVSHLDEFDPPWWQRAEPDDAARAWETAQAWRELDPDARQAAESVHDKVPARYGVLVRGAPLLEGDQPLLLSRAFRAVIFSSDLRRTWRGLPRCAAGGWR